MILGNVTLVFIMKSLILKMFSRLSLMTMINFFWTSFSTMIGGEESNTSIDERKSYKVTSFISLLGGMIIWIAYQSFLTAELAIVSNKFPFNDIESLSRTDFK